MRATFTESRESWRTTTDASGAYEFRELSAGRYQLSASKGSFVPLQYGQTRAFEAGRPLDIGDGQTIERVDFSLPRGGVITGRVVDEFGEPTTDVQVSALRYQFKQGRRQLVPVGRIATTNDVGEYRLFGLPPGSYYLSATLRSTTVLDTATADRLGYAPTYYPDALSVSGAQRLTVDLGRALYGIDMVLGSARMARISGTVVDAAGHPMTHGTVIAVQTDSGVFAPSGRGQIRPDGTFILTNIGPGEYTLVALSPQTALAGEPIEAFVVVTGEDISGLRLAGITPAVATGRVVLPQAGGGSVRASSIRLITAAVHPKPALNLVGGSVHTINDDFTFELKVQPGLQVVRLAPQVTGVTLKAVRLNGTDVTDIGIEFRSGGNVGGLEVELTAQLSELSGVVRDVTGRPVKDYTMIVFPRDPQLWTNTSRHFGSSRPDQNGRYRVRCLPPGDYLAVALDYIEPGSGTDPEFLETVRYRATPFPLAEGEIRTTVRSARDDGTPWRIIGLANCRVVHLRAGRRRQASHGLPDVWRNNR